MGNEVFKLKEVTPEQVIIEVNAKDPLVVAKHPYVSSEYKYITVTRGGAHTLTVIKEDGKKLSFDWGSGGTTLISDSLQTLRKKVVEFLQAKCVFIEVRTTDKPNSGKLHFNRNYNKWQANFYFNNSKGGDWVLGERAELEKLLQASGLKFKKQEKAETGIDVWLYEKTGTGVQKLAAKTKSGGHVSVKKPIAVYDNDFNTRVWYYGKKNGKAVIKIITKDIRTDKQVEALAYREYTMYKDKHGDYFNITLPPSGRVKLYLTKEPGGVCIYRRAGFIKDELPF